MENEHFCEHKKKFVRPLVIVLIVFFVILAVSTAVDVVNKIKQGRYIGQDIELRNSIVISETGEVYAKPDLGVVSFSVVNDAKNVSDAMNENTKKMNDIIKVIKEQGVEDKDLKTTGFNVYPLYEYTERGYGERILAGYEVSQQLQVKIRDLDKTGAIIETATTAGATNMSGLNFVIDNEDDLKKQAREQAIAKAKTKAQELANQLGVKLGRIVNFNENSYNPYYGMEASMDSGMGKGGAVPDIQTGENRITSSVVITYEIY